jgi:hypothetical protein
MGRGGEYHYMYTPTPRHSTPTSNMHTYTRTFVVHAYIRTRMGRVITSYICVICIIITLQNTSTSTVYTRTLAHACTRRERTLLKTCGITHTHTYTCISDTFALPNYTFRRVYIRRKDN